MAPFYSELFLQFFSLEAPLPKPQKKPRALICSLKEMLWSEGRLAELDRHLQKAKRDTGIQDTGQVVLILPTVF
jgi:hypothetical protein